ncbi:thioredoxin family protein [Candidatus Woesearchaeota archaeon]|nr:thioredoxin family protein [Candidatus Woesearchaeota archaeon]
MEMNIQNLKLKIGDKAPDFSLPGVDGKAYSLSGFKGKKILVVVFMCNHCPYVQAYIERMKAIQSDFGVKSVQVVGINSNDEVNYPDDSFEKMIELNKQRKLNFPYLRDEDQTVASAYGAQCTPECFVLDADRKLRYHGRIDDNYKDEKAVKTYDLRNAINSLIHNQKAAIELTPAIGCSIKWR